MSEFSKGEHGPESGHQTVEKLIAKNEATVAEKRTAIEGLQGQIAEVRKKVRAEQSEIYKLEGEIAEPKRYRERLVEFVNRLRQQDVADWGYSNIVNGLFNPDQPPVLNHNLERSLTPAMKQEIVQSVLAETGLTGQEGQELVEKQTANSKKQS